jgi:hypothetical protein
MVDEISTQENIEKLSQELFGKPSKDIKYLYITGYIHQQLLEEELARTGLYQWINIFDGEIKYPRDVVNYNDYDIVHINMSGQDLHLVGDVRAKIGDNSKTKLIVNNDYTTEMWQNAFDFPTTVEREISYADMVFGTEYYQVTALSELTGRRCYVIPHSCDIKRLKTLPEVKKKNIISTVWRRYDNFYMIPSLAVRNQGMTTRLIGYDKNVDKKSFIATTLFDYVTAGTNYFEYTEQMRESKIVYNPFTFHSFDRGTIDCAAMGVAVVGSNRTQSMGVCYPHTICDPYDVTKARELIKKLNTDSEFYDLVVKTALEKCEFYNHENSKERFLMSLSDALKQGRKSNRSVIETKIKESGIGDDVNTLKAKELNR